MVGRITRIAAVTLLTIHVVLSTSAQEEPAQPARRSPLGDRLQRFREEIFGEAPRRGAPKAPRKTVDRPPPVVVSPGQMVSPGQVVPQSEAGQMGRAERSVPPASSSVRVPSYLESQGARPARTSPHRGAPVVDGPTESMRTRIAPIRRPIEEARLRRAETSGADEPDDQQDVEVQQEPGEAAGEMSPLAPEVPRPAIPDDAVRDHGGLEPLDEPAHSLGPEGAHPPHEGSPPDVEESDADSDPESAKSLDESMPADDGPAQSLDEPSADEESQRALDEPRPSFDEPAESLDEPKRAIDEPAESHDEPKRALDKPAEAPEAADASDVLFTSQSPVLSVEASGPRTVLIGKEAAFVVKLKNAGAAANHVVVSIHIPNYADVAATQPTRGTAQPAAGTEQHETLEWTIDRLEADSSETLALTLVPRKSSPLDLAVNWTFTPETSQTMVEVQEPKLAMSLSGPTDVLYGQTKFYKLTISNPGNGDTENVSVGLAPVGRSGDAPATHPLGTLKAGESKTIDVELTARQAGAITIKAHAFADGGLRAEAAEQVLVRRASLQVEVEAPRVKYAGTDGTFRVKVENVGNAAAENVHVSAMLPPDAKFIGASNGGRPEPQRGQVNWTVGLLQPGGERVFELQCSLSAPGDNRLQFAAAADGGVTAAATSNTRVEAIADLKLEVRDPQGPVAVGDEAHYEIRIHNRGTKAAEGIEAAVFFSEGLEATAADGGPHDIGAGQVIFRPIATLGAGDTTVFHIRGRAETGGNHVVRAEVTCQSPTTKLATEEATYFYGERRAAAAHEDQPNATTSSREPTLAAPPDDLPTPAAGEGDDESPAPPRE